MKRYIVTIDDWTDKTTPPLTLHIRTKTDEAIYKGLSYYLTDYQKAKLLRHFGKSVNKLHIAGVK